MYSLVSINVIRDYSSGIICGAIINDNDFKILIGLLQNRIQTFPNVCCAITHGYGDGHKRQFIGWCQRFQVESPFILVSTIIGYDHQLAA